MRSSLSDLIPRMEKLAREQGLDYFPVDFEEIPPSFMMEVAVYGLPVRMTHWSFGVRWIYQMVQHQMGHSRVFEVVFPGNPNRAYLVSTNTLTENVLVAAHVLGHADFSKCNLVFDRSRREAGNRIVEQAAAHAHRIEQAVEIHGQQRVEQVLDAALALEQHIDSELPLHRRSHVETEENTVEQSRLDCFRGRYASLPGESQPPAAEEETRAPRPEKDLLWFIARHAPEMEDWERDIFLAVREESYYFKPVFSCQIMNEGWACHWHAKLLREAPFLSESMYVDAMKVHSDVVRPFAGEHEVALSLNPYHLGFVMWDRIVEREGMKRARQIMREEDDFGFVRNHLDMDLVQELKLFLYTASKSGTVRIRDLELHELHEAILSRKYNFGAPRVCVEALENDGSLTLRHNFEGDGRGLELESARHVLDYVARVWHRPVSIVTADEKGGERLIRSNPAN